jgi:hypothetical protein
MVTRFAGITADACFLGVSRQWLYEALSTGGKKGGALVQRYQALKARQGADPAEPPPQEKP